MVNATARALYPRERTGIHCTGGWVCPRAAWTGAEYVASIGIRSPDPPARSESLYRLSYPSWIRLTENQLTLVHENKTDYLHLENNYNQHARFEIPTAFAIDITVFVHVTPCMFVETSQHFEGIYCFHLQDRRIKHAWKCNVYTEREWPGPQVCAEQEKSAEELIMKMEAARSHVTLVHT